MSRAHAIDIFKQAVAAVQPAGLLQKNVHRNNDSIRIGTYDYPLPANRPVWVFGAGKASAAMAQTLEEILVGIPLQGLIITKYEHALPLQQLTVIEAAHPVPDEQGVQATLQMKSLLAQVQEHDLVIFLLSGGASALLVDYPEGSSLAATQELFGRLLKSGADIHQMNAVRKHLSAVKGGQLALLAKTTAFCSLILSDVVGDDLHVIGSGPTVPDPSTLRDVTGILNKYGLTIPESLLHETPKPGDPRFKNIQNLLIGSNKIALEAAAKHARSLGYNVLLSNSKATGDATILARKLVQEAIGFRGSKPACVLIGGETTVRVTGHGLGGRNQHLALAALSALQNDQKNITLLSAGTDGTDGPTDAAGAVVDAAVIALAAEKGLDAALYLKNNDAYHFFEQTNGLLKTGPTHTNVMDIIVVIINY